jgi:pyruvate dehydrogenase E1 component beta subunit
MSYSTIEIIKIYKKLKKNRLSIDHFDVNIIRPLQVKNIFNSLKKTGKLLILDNSSHKFCSIGSEIISQLIQIEKNIFKKEPILLTIPEIPSPSSFYLTKDYYYNEKSIVCAFEKLLGKRINCYFPTKLHDIPDPAFKGPF